jgi:lincosamide nucleotidyltransferase A/C/D/E
VAHEECRTTSAATSTCRSARLARRIEWRSGTATGTLRDVLEHHMSATDARTLLSALQSAGVDVCLGGGWGVDALLGEENRPHSDLDLWCPAQQLHDLLRVLVHEGVDRVFPWPGDRPWNWVLHDGRRRVDLHLYEAVKGGLWHYGSALGGDRLPDEALAAEGTVDGLAVRCEAPIWALRFHTGYPARDIDRQDVRRLCERFALTLPAQFE